MNKINLIIFVSLLLFCCKNNVSDNFESYYQSTFNRHLESEKDLYLFLPSNSCSSCIDKLIFLLSKNKRTNNIHLIFVYKSKAFFNNKKKLLESYDLVLDKKLIAVEHEIIDGFKPVLMEYKNHKLINVLEVDVSSNWDESLKIINKYYN